jgi:hypothetical protein
MTDLPPLPPTYPYVERLCASFKAQETDPKTGLSVRVIKDYDFNGDFERIRLDILYGVKTLDPRLGARMSGTN